MPVGSETIVTEDQPPAVEEESTADLANRARLQVDVPANAQVWVSGERTAQTGAVRTFLSPQLTLGKTYLYTVRARWISDSGMRDETRKVYVRPNETVEVDFTTSSAPQTLRTPPVER